MCQEEDSREILKYFDMDKNKDKYLNLWCISSNSRMKSFKSII